MIVPNAKVRKAESILPSERQPTEMLKSVVFSGDGEPKTPESTLLQLLEIQKKTGIASDNYSLGGVVDALEQKMAQELGKEAAVFMTTGTLANHIAIRNLCGSRRRVVVQEQSHLYNDSGDCVQHLSGIHMVPLASGEAFFTLSHLEDAIKRSNTGRVSTPVGAIMIESPVRRQGGQVMPFDEIKTITDFCNEQNIGTHLDGARLYMMCAASGVKPKDYSALFDTVYVSMYKYFGAPFGAVIAGSAEFCEGLFHDRRMFGSGLSSSAFAAALALEGIDGFQKKFDDAMIKGESLFKDLNEINGIHVGRYKYGSNIFPVTFDRPADIEELSNRLKEHWIFLPNGPDDYGRWHLTLNTTILRQSNDDIVNAWAKAMV